MIVGIIIFVIIVDVTVIFVIVITVLAPSLISVTEVLFCENCPKLLTDLVMLLKAPKFFQVDQTIEYIIY